MSELTNVFTNIANAIRTKNGSSDTYTPSEMAQAIEDIPLPEDAYYLKTVSGNPISIDDGEEFNAESVKLTLLPKQDLHGYDKPWAGGAGKNKWDGTFNTLIPIEIVSGTTVCLQAVLNDTSGYIALRTYDSNQTFLQSMTTVNISGNINYGALTLTSDAAYIRVEKASGTTATDGMLSIGNTQPTAYEPYSNICPIEGYEEASATRTGKNLFNGTNILSAYISSDKLVESLNTKSVYIPCFPNTTYTISKTAGQRFAIATTYEMPNINVPIHNYIGDNTASSITITTDSYSKYLVAFVYNANFDSGTAQEMIDSVQIEFGNQSTPYEPYDEATATAEFEETIYGAEGDIVTGEWGKTWQKVDMGSLFWTRNTYSGITYFLSSSISSYAKGTSFSYLCEIYKAIANGGVTSLTEDKSFFIYTNGNIYVRDDSYTDPTDFKTAMSGVELAYELATPEPFQTAPAPLTLRKGDNVVTTDANSLELKYWSKTKTVTPPNTLLMGALRSVQNEENELSEVEDEEIDESNDKEIEER